MHSAHVRRVILYRANRGHVFTCGRHLLQGWDGARKHALRAVTTDNFMRIWVADDSLTTGLLFRCSLGRILMDAPVCEPPTTCAHTL
jgi:hypothetical protein